MRETDNSAAAVAYNERAKTATATSIKSNTEEMERRRFEAMAHDFVNRWQPEDRYEAARFSAELFSLVRQLFIDVQEPLQKTVVSAMNYVSLPKDFMVPKK